MEIALRFLILKIITQYYRLKIKEIKAYLAVGTTIN